MVKLQLNYVYATAFIKIGRMTGNFVTTFYQCKLKNAIKVCIIISDYYTDKFKITFFRSSCFCNITASLGQNFQLIFLIAFQTFRLCEPFSSDAHPHGLIYKILFYCQEHFDDQSG